MTAWIWKNRVAYLVVLVVSMVAFDQATKIWAQGALTEEREVVRPKEVATEDGTVERVEVKVMQHVAVRTIEVIPGLFNFKYAENRAAAFSLTESVPEGLRRPLLLAVSLLACVLIAVWYLRLRAPDALLMTAFALIIGGALGNLIDRARLAYVIDFLDFYVAHDGIATWLRQLHSLPFGAGSFRLSDHWPTFNIADMCIVSGAIGVILRTLRPLSEQKA